MLQLEFLYYNNFGVLFNVHFYVLIMLFIIFKFKYDMFGLIKT